MRYSIVGTGNVGMKAKSSRSRRGDLGDGERSQRGLAAGHRRRRIAPGEGNKPTNPESDSRNDAVEAG